MSQTKEATSKLHMDHSLFMKKYFVPEALSIYDDEIRFVRKVAKDLSFAIRGGSPDFSVLKVVARLGSMCKKC